MNYYIGIDGGGTKSRILAADQTGQPIDLLFGKSTNLASNTEEFVRRSLNGLFTALLTKNNLAPAMCLGLCIGSAGLDFPENCELMENIIRETGFICPVLAVNDSLPVLVTATGGKPGVVLISGTGSIAYGIDSKGNRTRVGGWGHIFDDEGSGYWIGKEALRHAFFAYDKRGEKTVLEDYLVKHFGVNDLIECMDKIYGDNAVSKAEIAELAFYVKEGAQCGDRVCQQILINAAKGLFLLADTALKNIDKEKPNVTVSGGCIMSNDILFDELKKQVNEAYPCIQVSRIEKEPVYGAVYLAMNRNNEFYL